MMTSDAKGNPKDEAEVLAGQETLPPEEGQPSGGKALEPSTPPKSYTQEQVDKLLDEKHSKLDKRIAEIEKQGVKSAKALELATKRASDAEAALVKTAKEQEEKELADIQDNEPELRLYRAKQKQRERDAELSKRERELEASKAEHDESLSELLVFKQTQIAQGIASKYEGVDAGLLIQLTDGSPEKMELLAGQLGTLKAKTPISPRPDSGLSSGGAGKLTAEQIEKMSAEDYAQHPSVKARFK